jgi:hypothetical protein
VFVRVCIYFFKKAKFVGECGFRTWRKASPTSPAAATGLLGGGNVAAEGGLSRKTSRAMSLESAAVRRLKTEADATGAAT